MDKFEWFEDKIYQMIFDENTGLKKGLLEIDTKTGEQKLHKQWCEITVKSDG